MFICVVITAPFVTHPPLVPFSPSLTSRTWLPHIIYLFLDKCHFTWIESMKKFGESNLQFAFIKVGGAMEQPNAWLEESIFQTISPLKMLSFSSLLCFFFTTFFLFPSSSWVPLWLSLSFLSPLSLPHILVHPSSPYVPAFPLTVQPFFSLSTPSPLFSETSGANWWGKGAEDTAEGQRKWKRNRRWNSVKECLEFKRARKTTAQIKQTVVGKEGLD